MKRKLIIVDFDGKETISEYKVRNKELLEAQLKNHSQIFKPKKGKGSFKRNKKISEEENL